MNEVAILVGFVPSEPVWTRQSREREPDLSIPERWRPGASHGADRRPGAICATIGIFPNRSSAPRSRRIDLREGPHGSMWAAHTDAAGIVTGWEERGPEWRGFATGGAKVLFRSVPTRAPLRDRGGDRRHEPRRARGLRARHALSQHRWRLVAGDRRGDPRACGTPGAQLVAATDNNKQGDIYAGRLLAPCWGDRLRRRAAAPRGDDWNADLKVRAGSRRNEGGRRPTAACPPAASRVKLRPAAPALDPAGRRGGRGGGVRKG
jgi:hypothetical protein